VTSQGEPTDPAPPAGIPAKYAVVRVLGRGGMGTVYEARDTVLETPRTSSGSSARPAPSRA
jgi:hypothetical protein